MESLIIAVSVSFISSKNSNETRPMHTKSHNIEIMMGREAGKIIKELFESFLQNYHKDLEKIMRGSAFIRDSVDLLYYHLQKISLKRVGSYIDSPKLFKNKKATINPKNNGNNCFQYALTATLNHHPERMSNLKPFIDQYNWKGINISSQKEDWKSSNQITSQLLLIFYLCHTMLKT